MVGVCLVKIHTISGGSQAPQRSCQAKKFEQPGHQAADSPIRVQRKSRGKHGETSWGIFYPARCTAAMTSESSEAKLNISRQIEV